jgi:SAM-dependent methyltransferase
VPHPPQRIFELARSGVRLEAVRDPAVDAHRTPGVPSLPAESRPWDEVAREPTPSWYLDPLVAAQKRALHLELIDRWIAGVPRLLLKTDLFEEAYGSDQLLPDLRSRCGMAIGLDISTETVRRARAQMTSRDCHRLPVSNLPMTDLLVSDLRRLAVPSGSVDLVISNSSLDHFRSEAEFREALAELARILRPGGQLIVTADNPVNPLYWPLRWLSRIGGAPFPLGYTPTAGGLVRRLRESGLEVTATASLIHNPRGISTLLFLALRRSLGARADRPVQALLRMFARLGRLPTRGITACFVAASARKPLG